MRTHNLIFGLIKAFFCTWFICMSSIVNADNERSDCYFKYNNYYYYFTWWTYPAPERTLEKFKEKILVTLTQAASPNQVLFDTSVMTDSDMMPNYGSVQLSNGHLSWVQSNNYNAKNTGWSFSKNGDLWHIQYQKTINANDVKCETTYIDNTGVRHTAGSADLTNFLNFSRGGRSSDQCSCM